MGCVRRTTSWDRHKRVRRERRRKKRLGVLARTKKREQEGGKGKGLRRRRRRATLRTYPCLRSSPRHFPPLLWFMRAMRVAITWVLDSGGDPPSFSPSCSCESRCWMDRAITPSTRSQRIPRVGGPYQAGPRAREETRSTFRLCATRRAFYLVESVILLLICQL